MYAAPYTAWLTAYSTIRRGVQAPLRAVVALFILEAPHSFAEMPEWLLHNPLY